MPYKKYNYTINNNVKVYFLDFESLNDNLKNRIDEYIMKLFI